MAYLLMRTGQNSIDAIINARDKGVSYILSSNNLYRAITGIGY